MNSWVGIYFFMCLSDLICCSEIRLTRSYLPLVKNARVDKDDGISFIKTLTKMVTMTHLLIKTDKKKLTKFQSTFNRLIKKIEKLQLEIKDTEAMLNQGLHYYHFHIRPVEKELVESLLECTPLFYSYYTYPESKLSKKERSLLKDLIQSLINDLSLYLMPQEMNAEMIEIINAIEGKDFKASLEAEIDQFKKETSDFAAQQGLDIDLSDVDLTTGSKEEILARLQAALLEAAEGSTEEKLTQKNTQNDKEKVKKKSAKELKKEQHAKEVEELQKRGLSKIYKQLAKTLHPDLERDPVVKAEKEILMKQLTTAYENQDLHTLLSLEITWMNHTTANEGNQPFQKADDQLKIYNVILEEQIESLEEQLSHAFTHPRYCDMQHIFKKDIDNLFLIEEDSSSILDILKDEKERLSHNVKRNFATSLDLKKSVNFKLLKRILKEVATPSEADMFNEIINSLTFLHRR